MGNKQIKYEGGRRSLEEIINNSHCYKELEFAWHSTKHGRYIRFIQDRVNSIKSYGPWGISMPSSLVISRSNCIEYVWAIKIHQNSHKNGSSIMMGFIFQSLIVNNNIDYNNNLNIDNEKQFIFQIGYGKTGVFKFYGENKLISDTITLQYGFNNEDIFKLRINFKKGDIELYYNGKFIGIIFNEIPINTKLIPCVALKNAQISLLTSNYIPAH
eukprot:UN10671